MKYPLLNDERWLRAKYLDERLSQIEIAKIVGCKSKTTVGNALRRLEIPLRLTTRKEIYGSKYPLLNNEQWLYSKINFLQMKFVIYLGQKPPTLLDKH